MGLHTGKHIPTPIMSFDLSDNKGISQLNMHLAKASYIEGFAPSNLDLELLESITAQKIFIHGAKYPHIIRWMNHINTFSEAERKNFAKIEKVEEEEDDDSDVDLFGSGDEDEEEAARKEMLRKKTAEVVARQAAYVNKDTTDLDELEAMIRETYPGGLEVFGLAWGAAKRVPIGYGIKKLQILCTIYDDKVSSDDLEDIIMSFEDHVQSVDFASWTKV